MSTRRHPMVIAELWEGTIDLSATKSIADLDTAPRYNTAIPCHDPKELSKTTFTFIPHGRVPKSWLSGGLKA